MSKNVIFVNANGDYEESGLVYESTDFVDASAGAGDAGKPVILDAGGQLASSMINEGGITHGNLGDLSADDHTQYSLADGTRSFTGIVAYDAAKSFSSDRDIVDKGYVDSVAAGLDPKESCRFVTLTDVSGTYSSSGGTGGTGSFTGVDLTNGTIFDLDSNTVEVGDRILLKNQTDAKENGIYVVTTAGATGVIERASDQDGNPGAEVSGGNFTFIENGATYGSTSWVLQGDGELTLNTDNLSWVQYSDSGAYTAGDGLDLAGNQFSVDVTDIIDSTSGLQEDASNNIQVKLESDGALAFDGSNGGIEVQVDTTVISINGSNQLTVSADGIDDTHINWGTTGTQVGADDIPIVDAGAIITATTVEGALAEIQGDLNAVEDNTISGGNGITASGTVGADNLSVSADVDGVTIISNGGSGSQLAVATDGIKDIHIDWGQGANQVNATDLPVDTGAGSYGGSATNVQDALEELESSIGEASGVEYTAGTGGVSKGDMLYVSANNTVSTYSDITQPQIVIGIASEAVAVGNTVKVLANDTTISGVFSSASAGAKYYWNGTGYTNSYASFSSGDYIWVGGVAKNSTDAHVQVDFITKKV